VRSNTSKVHVNVASYNDVALYKLILHLQSEDLTATREQYVGLLKLVGWLCFVTRTDDLKCKSAVKL
jgi:hypothetical protein